MAFNGSDSWLSAHDNCVARGREIMEQLIQRNQLNRNTGPFVHATSRIRQLIKQFTSDVSQLETGLNSASITSQITTREAERRQYMLNTLLNKKREMESLLHENAGLRHEARGALFGSDLASAKSNEAGWNADETEATQDLTVEQIREQQQMAVKAQDRGLENLSHVIGRQKQMALGFNQELDLHNEILDDIENHTDRVNSRLIRETKNVQLVDRKAGTCGYWVVILLLMVAIVVVAAVKF
ncbi:syntaxin-8-like [Ornithodoros turicata]|uniref:syntaxin-8-like n=1 Tax=Ornithodoros turicata TaxID=34597 RepID=UPI0031396425